MTDRPPGPPLRRLLGRVLAGVGVLYLLVLVAAFLLQRRALYLPQRLDLPVVQPRAANEEIVTFPSADGTRISGLYVRAPDMDAPVALVAHGNAGNVLTWRRYLDPFLGLGLSAFLLDPRGYGWSEGSPDEEGWHQDAEAALAWLASQGVPAARVVVVGVSIGAGLAVPLAARHPVRGLILQSAFTSLAAAAADHYPYLPCALLLRDRYDNLASAPGVRCPVLILHGTDDRTVPVEHAQRLAAAFPGTAAVRLASGRDHNDVALWPGYVPALEEFLGSLN